jgi:TolB-like protein
VLFRVSGHISNHQLADVLTEDVITDLSRYREMDVNELCPSD